VRTVPASPSHIVPLLAALSTDDRALLDRLAGNSAALLLRHIGDSDPTWCGLDDADGVVTMGGVIPKGDGEGYIWQLATPAIASHKRDYILQSRMMMAKGLPLYRRLTTTIRADFTAALRHMRRMGFTIQPPADVAGLPACRCERMLP